MCVLALKSHRLKIWVNATNVAPPLPDGPAAAVPTPTVDAADIATTVAAIVLRICRRIVATCRSYLPAFHRE
jgi:hypothetical protein